MFSGYTSAFTFFIQPDFSGSCFKFGPSPKSAPNSEKNFWQILWCWWFKKKKKNPPANEGDKREVGSVPGSGRSPGEGNGNPLQYSCLENPMDRGARRATVHRVAKSAGTAQNPIAQHRSLMLPRKPLGGAKESFPITKGLTHTEVMLG